MYWCGKCFVVYVEYDWLVVMEVSCGYFWMFGL